jgi:ketosteroid isomerase-like protein
MKNKIAKGIFSGLISSLVISCNAKNEAPTTSTADKDQIKKEIQARENEFAEIYNSGQLKNIGYYANDATTFFPNRPALVGKQAIVDFLTSDLDSNTDKITFNTNEVFVSNDANQVVEVGYFKIMDSSNVIINTGNYMSLFEKRNDKYVCVRDMSASDMPVKN